MASNKPGTDLEAGTRPAKRRAGMSHRPREENALQGRFGMPGDLAAFVRESSTTDVRQALGVGQSTVMRLRAGYWPQDARKLLAAWEAHKGRSAQQRSGWFLRRVYPGGVVLHAGGRWSVHGLAVRVGQQLAVARSSAGLLVQTLELPSQRFELVSIHG